MVPPAVQALWQQLGVFAGGPLLRLVGRDVACLHLLFAIALYRPRTPLAELSFDHISQGHVWHAHRLVRPLTASLRRVRERERLLVLVAALTSRPDDLRVEGSFSPASAAAGPLADSARAPQAPPAGPRPRPVAPARPLSARPARAPENRSGSSIGITCGLVTRGACDRTPRAPPPRSQCSVRPRGSHPDRKRPCAQRARHLSGGAHRRMARTPAPTAATA